MPPFVEVGSQITADTEVCLIEVMKLFTTVRSGIEGIIREVYPTDAAMVEFDQPLFLVEPHG
jgi:acetyl-CoA carboxylase biotin carboxyl carrier protein